MQVKCGNAGRQVLPSDGDCDLWQRKTSNFGESYARLLQVFRLDSRRYLRARNVPAMP
jgi:hypothetical protein